MKYEKPGAKAPSHLGVVSQGLKALLPRINAGAPTSLVRGKCGRYEDWLTDASLGELASVRKAELRAHAAECQQCREAYNRARELSVFAEQIDRGIESLVAGEPSPHFHSRLRARIAEESAPAHVNWRAWTPVAASAIALAILLVAVALRSPRVNAPYVAKNTPAPSASAQTSNPPTQAVSAGENSRSRPLHSHNQPVNVRAKPHAEPKVLVEPGQLAAIMQYADAVHASHVDGEKLLAAQQQANAPLEIKPIEIVPLSPESDATDGAPSNQTRP